MQTLLRHDNVVFEDQTVYVTGNAYIGCEFHRCTMILKGFPFHMESSQFHGCIWAVDFVIHDRVQLTELTKAFEQMVMQSLPIHNENLSPASELTGAGVEEPI